MKPVGCTPYGDFNYDWKKVTVVITTHNRRDKVIATVDSVLKSNDLNVIAEIIIVDDASTDGTCTEIEKKFCGKEVRIVRLKHQRLISECRNIGLDKSTTEYVFFLDDDVIISPSTISELANFLSNNKEVACVMPMIMYYNKPDIIWSAGIRHNFWTTVGRLLGRNKQDVGQFKWPVRQNDSVSTAFMVRRSIVKNNKFDSVLFPIGWEDTDFATRLRRLGFDIVVLPSVKVWHDYSGPHFLKNKLRLFYEVRNRILFHRRWATNGAQYLVSVAFSVAVGFSYIIVSLFFSKHLAENIKSIFKGIISGLSYKFRYDNKGAKRQV